MCCRWSGKWNLPDVQRFDQGSANAACPARELVSGQDIADQSSLLIVPVPGAWGSVAPLGALRLAANPSWFSMAVSPLMVTAKVLLVRPAAMVSPPRLWATKSLPAVAVPPLPVAML